MQHIAKAYFSLTGEAPSEETIQRLSKIQAALQIPETDALWSVYMASELYLSMYEDIPEKIRETSEHTLRTGSQALSDVLKDLVSDLETKYLNHISSLEELLTKFRNRMVAAQAKAILVAYLGAGFGVLLGAATGYGVWAYHLNSARKDEASVIRRVEIAKQYLSETQPVVQKLREEYRQLEPYGVGLIRIEDDAVLVRVPNRSAIHDGSLTIHNCTWFNQTHIPCVKLEPEKAETN